MSNINVTNVNGKNADAGKANAWANGRTTGTVSILGSFNTSSIVDIATGIVSFNYASEFVSGNNSLLTQSSTASTTGGGVSADTTNTIQTLSTSWGNIDANSVCYATYGDLA